MKVKNRSLLILVLFLFPLIGSLQRTPDSLWAGGPEVFLATGTAGGGGCTWATSTALFDNTAISHNETSTLYVDTIGTYFTLGTSSTVTGYKLIFANLNGTSGNITGALYGGTSSAIGSIISGSSQTVNVTVAGEVDFILDTPKAGQSGGLWVAFNTTDGSQYMSVYAGPATGYAWMDAGPSYLDNYSLQVAVMGCTP